ncbi:hypothetical protein BC940DRAFT_295261 [Gongronella butleri]|nr:hypothetical protein BC940DRAFT_295261 [Gongronella butleri]
MTQFDKLSVEDIYEKIMAHNVCPKEALDELNGNVDLVVGAIESLEEPRTARNGQSYNITGIRLASPSLAENFSIKIRLFARDKESLPSPVTMKLNDIILVKNFKKDRGFTGAWGTRYIGFSYPSVEPIRFPRVEYELNDSAKQVAQLMSFWVKHALGGGDGTDDTGKSRPRKNLGLDLSMYDNKDNMFLGTSEHKSYNITTPICTKDLLCGKFYYKSFTAMIAADPLPGIQYVGEHKVKMMYLTDFTKNPMPQMTSIEGADYPIDPEITIGMSLFDENAEDCPDFKAGDVAEFRNVQCSKKKINGREFLELAIHGETIQRSIKVHWLDPLDADHMPVLKHLIQTYEKYKVERKKEQARRKLVVDVPIQEEIQLAPVAVICKGINGVDHKSIADALETGTDQESVIRATVVSYKPLDLVDALMVQCGDCGECSGRYARYCHACGSNLADGRPVQRVTFVVQDEEGKQLMAYAYGSEDDPLFNRIPFAFDESDEALAKVEQLMSSLCPNPMAYIHLGKRKRDDLSSEKDDVDKPAIFYQRMLVQKMDNDANFWLKATFSYDG